METTWFDVMTKISRGEQMGTALGPLVAKAGAAAAQQAVVGKMASNGAAAFQGAAHNAAMASAAKAGAAALAGAIKPKPVPGNAAFGNMAKAGATALAGAMKPVPHDAQVEKALYVNMLATAIGNATGPGTFSLDAEISGLIARLSKLRDDKQGRQLLQQAAHGDPKSKDQLAQIVRTMGQAMQQAVGKKG